VCSVVHSEHIDRCWGFMKKAVNRSNVAPRRSKLVIHRETIALLSAVQLNRVTSGVPAGSTETMDVACDTTVSTQTH